MIQVIDDERSDEQWLGEANILSRRVTGLDARTAWAFCQLGAYRGTSFQSKLSQLMWLAGEK